MLTDEQKNRLPPDRRAAYEQYLSKMRAHQNPIIREYAEVIVGFQAITDGLLIEYTFDPNKTIVEVLKACPEILGHMIASNVHLGMDKGGSDKTANVREQGFRMFLQEVAAHAAQRFRMETLNAAVSNPERPN